MGNDSLRGAGHTSRYWSRNGAVATAAYYIHFDASDIRPSYGPSDRYYGFSLRCLQE